MHKYEKFIDWGNRQTSVRALILTGSLASPAPYRDALSDYDLILVLTDMHPFFEQRDWLKDFGSVLVFYPDPLFHEDGLETSGYIVQYESGLKIDFTLWSVEMLARVTAAPELPAEFDAGYRVLLDKDGLTQGLKPPTYRGYIPPPPTETEYLNSLQYFFLDVCYTAKFLWRDDPMAVKYMLDNMIKQDYLRPMLEWHAEIDANWSIKPGPFGRRLKQWLRPDLWAALAATYTGAGIEENWQTLDATIALMRQVAVEVGEKLGYAYPHDLEARVLSYVAKIRALPR